MAAFFAKGEWSLKKFNATVINDIWLETLFFTLIATMVTSVTELTRHKLEISNQLITVLGVVLGFVISFRTSSAYERYQDGRKLWTNIAVISRNLAQSIWIHISPDRIEVTDDTDPDHVKKERLRAVIEKRSMINLILAFAVSVKHFLRGEPGIYYTDLYDLVAFLPRHHLVDSEGDDVTDHDILPIWINHGKPASSTSKTPESDHFDPEKASPHVMSEVRLRPGRDPPKLTIYDHMPFLLVFRPLILLLKWVYKRYVVRRGTAQTDLESDGRTITGKKKARPHVTSNIPLEVTLYLHSYFRFLLNKPGLVQPAIAVGIITNLNLLQDTVNNLERVQTTPIPFAYQAHLHMSLWLYLAFLPFQIVSTMGWWTIPGTCFTSFLLLGFLEIGQEIENPFNYDENDLDLDTFCEAIQDELHEITAHPYIDIHSYVFSDFNKPFAPSDNRTAREILSDPTHEYHTHSNNMEPIRRTLLRNWKDVQQKKPKKD